MQLAQKIAVIGLCILLVSCSSEKMTQEQSSFRETCLTNGHGWMKMSELRAGKVIGPPCYGCMPDDNNHYCKLGDYNEGIPSGNAGDGVDGTVDNSEDSL